MTLVDCVQEPRGRQDAVGLPPAPYADDQNHTPPDTHARGDSPGFGRAVAAKFERRRTPRILYCAVDEAVEVDGLGRVGDPLVVRLLVPCPPCQAIRSGATLSREMRVRRAAGMDARGPHPYGRPNSSSMSSPQCTSRHVRAGRLTTGAP